MAKMPLAPFERILRESGKNIRVSLDSAQEFANAMGEIASEIAEEACLLARHAGRKTVKAPDVEMAFKRFQKK